MERVQLSAFNLVSFDEEGAASNRRRPGRIRCERLGCPGGRVLDISRTGARLRIRAMSAPRDGQKRMLVFSTAMGPSLPYVCMVRWVKPVGMFAYEVGVQFEGLDAAREAQLQEMSRVHSGRTVLGNIDAAA
ncbi:MAG TPA: PilZ domain-containing protein [Phycisphaerales bacterium]|nr:PilZ domain-containing protein [Phycisphaerales bacterium]